MLISDGRGKNGDASVSAEQRLNVSAKTAPRIFYVARDNERSFTWISSYSATSGDTVMYIKNTDTDRNLIIHYVSVGGANSGKYDIYTASGTPAGTTITPTNLNVSSRKEANSTQYGGAAVTGVSTVSKLYTKRVLANQSEPVHGIAQAVILGFGDSIAITYTGSTGEMDVEVTGYFEDPEER